MKILISTFILLLVITGCDCNYCETNDSSLNKPQGKFYKCDEWDALIHCINGDTIIVDRVESPAKTKNGMICIYDKWRSFDARIQIPVEQVKYVEFVKP